MTDQEKIKLLEDEGFIPQTKFLHAPKPEDKEQVPTGRYVLSAYEPEPVIELTNYGFIAKIGSLWFKMYNAPDLKKFMDKAVPTYCERLKLLI